MATFRCKMNSYIFRTSIIWARGKSHEKVTPGITVITVVASQNSIVINKETSLTVRIAWLYGKKKKKFGI